MGWFDRWFRRRRQAEEGEEDAEQFPTMMVNYFGHEAEPLFEPQPRNEDLEAAIRAAPSNHDAFLVYGDWLSQQGHAAGEFIAVDDALRHATTVDEWERIHDRWWRLVAERRSELEATSPEALFDVVWHRGFVRWVRWCDSLDELGDFLRCAACALPLTVWFTEPDIVPDRARHLIASLGRDDIHLAYAPQPPRVPLDAALPILCELTTQRPKKGGKGEAIELTLVYNEGHWLQRGLFEHQLKLSVVTWRGELHAFERTRPWATDAEWDEFQARFRLPRPEDRSQVRVELTFTSAGAPGTHEVRFEGTLEEADLVDDAKYRFLAVKA